MVGVEVTKERADRKENGVSESRGIGVSGVRGFKHRLAVHLSNHWRLYPEWMVLGLGAHDYDCAHKTSHLAAGGRAATLSVHVRQPLCSARGCVGCEVRVARGYVAAHATVLRDAMYTRKDL